jgi:hypothetical protein
MRKESGVRVRWVYEKGLTEGCMKKQVLREGGKRKREGKEDSTNLFLLNYRQRKKVVVGGGGQNKNEKGGSGLRGRGELL